MSLNKKRGLLALLLALALGAGVSWYVTRHVIPGMRVTGNRTLLTRAATAFEDYYADHQRWPAGPPMEVVHRLAGRSEENIAEWRAYQLKPQDAAAPPPGETIRREKTIPAKNTLSQHGVRLEASVLADAWANPLHFHFSDDGQGPATLTSMGPDQQLGTRDDQSVSLRMSPRRMTPTPATFEAVTRKRQEQELRAAEQALRKARREAARAAAAAARQAP